MTLAPTPPAGLDDATLAAAADDLAGRGTLTFLVDDRAITYRVEGARLVAQEDAVDGDTVVRLDTEAWADLVGQVRTFINLYLTGALTFERGGFEQLADWDPALKYLHAGIPPYDPARADLGGRDPGASFTLQDSDDELRAQLAAMGFLHVQGVFTADEMASANTEVDRLASIARPGDDQSWWVTGESGAEVLCRLVYATLRSSDRKSVV